MPQLADPLDKSHSPQVFSPLARRYDLTNRLLSWGQDGRWRRRLVRWARPRPGERLLDLCTGTAEVALAFARCQPRLEIIGLDLSSEMLAVGRAKLAKLHRPVQITLQEGDALRPSFPAESFDLVTIAFGLRNLPDYRQALRQMRRVLHPGGRLLILEFAPPSALSWGGLYRLYLHHWLPRLGGWLSGTGREAYAYLERSIRDFPRPDRMVTLMKEEGFAPVRLQKLSGGIVTLYHGERPSSDSSSRRVA